jgi:hypothetical protein
MAVDASQRAIGEKANNLPKKGNFIMPDSRLAAAVPASVLVAIALCACADGSGLRVAQQATSDIVMESDAIAARHFDAYNSYRALAEAAMGQSGGGTTGDSPLRVIPTCSPRMLLIEE